MENVIGIRTKHLFIRVEEGIGDADLIEII